MDSVINEPWGYHQVERRGKNTLTRSIIVNAGAETELWRHSNRTVAWSLISGTGVAFVAGTEYDLNQTIYIPKYSFHRIKNTGTGPLLVYEVQSGDISEDDLTVLEEE